MTSHGSEQVQDLVSLHTCVVLAIVRVGPPDFEDGIILRRGATIEHVVSWLILRSLFLKNP